MRVALVNYGHFADHESGKQVLDAFRTLTGWATGLKQAGVDVRVFQGFSRDEKISRAGVDYELVAGRFAPQLPRWRLPLRLHRRLLRFRPDVVHVNCLLYALQSLDLRRRLPVGSVLIQQHHAEVPSRGIWRRFERAATVRSDAVFFTGRGLAEPWIDFPSAGASRYPTVYELAEGSSTLRLLDRHEARRQSGMAGNPVFFWAGNLDSNKDPLTVLHAFGRLRRRRPEARLYMAFRHASLLPEVERFLAADTGLSSSVELLGAVTYDELEPLFNSADFFLQGSHREGSGYAVLDALACGAYPIITDLPSFRFLTEDGKYGRLWAVGDANALHEALIAETSGPRTWTRRELRRYFDQRLSFSAIGRQAKDAYTAALARRRNPVP